MSRPSERIRYLRDALSDQLADATCSRIDRALGPDLADDLEDIMSAARQVAAHARRAAPGALQGAATGFLAGGPAGALLGGALGAAGSLASPAGAAMGSIANPAGAITGPIANPAALELLLTVLRPEIVEALIAMSLGRMGAQSVPVNGVPVPVSAAANLVQSLAEEAAASHPMLPIRRIPRFLGEAHSRGEDISSVAVRAEALRSLLREATEEFDDDYDDIDFDDDLIGAVIDQEAEMEDILDIERLGGFER